MGHQNIRKEIIDTAQKMLEQGLVHGTWGNVSCRVPDEPLMLITPSGMDYMKLEPEDLVVVDWEGNPVEGGRQPSTESLLHGKIYKHRPDVEAIVHCHSPHATAFAVAGRPIPVITEELAQIAGAPIQVAPYQACGTAQLAETAAKVLDKSSAVLLANHGLVSAGKDLNEALRNCLIVERTAQITVLAETLGGYIELDPDQVDHLRQTFLNEYGQRK